GNGAALFFLAFAALNLFLLSNIPFPIGTIMAERFMYLPLIGVIGATAGGLQTVRWPSRIPAWGSGAAVAAIVALLSVRTWARNEDWRDGERLFASVIRVCPNSNRGYKGLA